MFYFSLIINLVRGPIVFPQEVLQLSVDICVPDLCLRICCSTKFSSDMTLKLRSVSLSAFLFGECELSLIVAELVSSFRPFFASLVIDWFGRFFPAVDDARGSTIVDHVQCYGACWLICGVLAGIYPPCRCCDCLLKRWRVGNQFPIYRFFVICGHEYSRNNYLDFVYKFANQ